MSWIKGKTFIITGASSGIGRDLVVKLVKEYKCTVIGIGRSKPKMESIKQELSYHSDNFTYHLFDTSIEKNWEMFAQYLKDKNIQPDILINNAGEMPPFDYYNHYSNEEIRRVMKINYYSVVYGVRYMKEILSESLMPGIINISSATALMPLPGTSIYAASKAAVKAYTEGLLAELGREMYISVIYPGFSMTDIFRKQYGKVDSGIIRFISTRPDIMASKIIRTVERRKNRAVLGKDAKLMNIASKFMPVLSVKFCEIIIRKSKAEIFDNIFPY